MSEIGMRQSLYTIGNEVGRVADDFNGFRFVQVLEFYVDRDDHEVAFTSLSD